MSQDQPTTPPRCRPGRAPPADHRDAYDAVSAGVARIALINCANTLAHLQFHGAYPVPAWTLPRILAALHSMTPPGPEARDHDN